MRLPSFIVLVMLSSNASAQISMPLLGSHPVLSGYAKALEGEVWPYFSVYPDYAKEALLTRCTNGQKIIAWETAPAPEKFTEPYVYFSWVAAYSTGTSKGIRHFDLYVNDRLALSFTTYPQQYPAWWSYAGSDSTRLVFEFKKQDASADAHGIAYLRVPASACTPGKPLRLKVVGQNQQSTDWYMTFKYSFEEKIEFVPLPFILRGTEENKQSLQINVLHFGPPDTLTVEIPNQPASIFTVQNGAQRFEVTIPSPQVPTQLPVKAHIGNTLHVQTSLSLQPVRPREIYLIHHSHTDIGYSHYQEDVAAIHNNNIRTALRLIDQTADYPEGSRFVWNVESLWAVENFLNGASEEEKQRFGEAVRNHQIGLSALYANVLTGLCSSDELRWWTEYADTLRAQFGAPINSAMFSDIPGVSWDAVPALSERGIRYFSNGPNYIASMPDDGDRIGSTLRLQGDNPFWWKSASGRDSILFWTCGKGYSSWHGFAPGAISERGPAKIADYLYELDAKQYPYDMVQWRYNIVSDNGPVDTTLSDFVKEWNEKYESPKLVIAQVGDFFEKFDQQYGQALPTLSGDFTPYWEDGAYSSAAEETENRMLSRRLSQMEHLAQQTGTVLPSDWWYQAKRHILLFHEHTWGSWNSISAPDDPFSTRQWAYKTRLLDSARMELQRIELALLPTPSAFNKITVINTLPFGRSGLVEMNWPDSLQSVQSLQAENGVVLPFQTLEHGKKGFWVENVPANGRTSYQVLRSSTALAGERPVNFGIDPLHGAVTSFRKADREWVDNRFWPGLMQAIYVPGRNPDSFSLATLESMEWLERGPVRYRLRLHGLLQGARSLQMDVMVLPKMGTLQFSVELDKISVREKESLHFALPFRFNDPNVRVGIGDTCYLFGFDQLPGANKDFCSVQQWLDVSNDRYGVSICAPQAALFEIGALVDERQTNNGYKAWKQNPSGPSNTVFLYALNNYWHTNYKADQSGKVRFDVYLSLHGEFQLDDARKFGASVAEPIIGIGN